MNRPGNTDIFAPAEGAGDGSALFPLLPGGLFLKQVRSKNAVLPSSLGLPFNPITRN